MRATRILPASLGVVFLGAGALKSLQPIQMVLGVGAYDLLPAPVALIGAAILPGLEIALGAALLTGFLARGSALLAAVISAIFLVFVVSAWMRGIDVTCGCFGPLSGAAQAGWRTALVDLLLFAASLFLCCTSESRGSAGSPVGRRGPGARGGRR
jgi:uncharacterized membrane protein YphA (DoxX/SURF4 family)